MPLEAWTRYSDEDVARLAADAPLIARRTPARCPVCGELAVRWYYHESAPPGRVVGFCTVVCQLPPLYGIDRRAALPRR
jgi:hypothetical protein